MKLQNCTRVFFELEISQSVKYFFRRWPIWNVMTVSEPTRIMTLLYRTSTQLNKFLTRLKITFHETAQEYFLSSKFDNLLITFFRRWPISNIISVSELTRNTTLLLRTSTQFEQVIDMIENHFSWNCARVVFELEVWQRVKYFFCWWAISNVISVSEPTRIMTLLLRTSTHLNKSSTRMKISFHETAKLHKSIFLLEISQRVKYVFRRWPIWNVMTVSEPTRIMTLLYRTSTQLNKFLTRLKITFHETAQEYFLSSKFDNLLITFFRRWPMSNIISFSEPTKIIKLLLRTSTHLNKSLTRLKITFHETAQE